MLNKRLPRKSFECSFALDSNFAYTFNIVQNEQSSDILETKGKVSMLMGLEHSINSINPKKLSASYMKDS